MSSHYRKGYAHQQAIKSEAIKRSRTLVLAFEEWEPHYFDRVKLKDIKAHQCRWPYGDPYEGSFRFCGNPVEGKSSYCPGHQRRAVNGTAPKLRFTIRRLNRSTH